MSPSVSGTVHINAKCSADNVCKDTVADLDGDFGASYGNDLETRHGIGV